MRKLVRGIVDFRNRVRPIARRNLRRARAGQKPTRSSLPARIAGCDQRVCLEEPEICSSCAPGHIVSPAAPDGLSVADESEPPPSSSRWPVGGARHHRLRPLQLRRDERPSPRPQSVAAPHLRSWLRHAERALERVPDRTAVEAVDRLSQANVLPNSSTCAATRWSSAPRKRVGCACTPSGSTSATPRCSLTIPARPLRALDERQAERLARPLSAFRRRPLTDALDEQRAANPATAVAARVSREGQIGKALAALK